MSGLGLERYEAGFEAETALLAALVVELAPDAPIPSCPEWTVRDLVSHVGTGHRWSAGVIEQRLLAPPEYVLVEAPREQGEWSAWLVAGARRLIEAIRAAGPLAEVWTWRPDRTAEFWLRKMLHDELIHRVDVELALGRAPGGVAPELAADGITDLMQTAERLSNLRHPVFGKLAGAGETLRFEAADRGDEAWLAERTPEGVTWRQGPGGAAVVVRAPVRELLLVLNRRQSPDTGAVEVTGERALLDHWLENSSF